MGRLTAGAIDVPSTIAGMRTDPQPAKTFRLLPHGSSSPHGVYQIGDV